MQTVEMRTTWNAQAGMETGRKPFGRVLIANVLLMVCTVALGVGYVVLNNTSSTKGFAIRALEQRVTDLEERNKALNLEAVTAQSLKDIESKVSNLGFVPVTQVDYLTVSDGAVAVK